MAPVRRTREYSVWSSARLACAMSIIDSSTSSIASTSLTTSLATWPASRTSSTRAAFGVEHRQPDARVQLAGRLRVGLRAQPLPRGEVALLDALLDQRDDALLVVVLHVLEHLVAGLGRLLEERGAGQCVLHRVGGRDAQAAGQHRQRQALDEQRARHHREGDEQQHLAVRRVLRDQERGGQRDHAADAGPAQDERERPGRPDARCWGRGRAAPTGSAPRTPRPSAGRCSPRGRRRRQPRCARWTGCSH